MQALESSEHDVSALSVSEAPAHEDELSATIADLDALIANLGILERIVISRLRQIKIDATNLRYKLAA